MNALVRMLQAVGRAIRSAARTVEVVAGMAMIAFGLYAFNEIVDIIRGIQPISGATPAVAVTLLAVAGLIGVTYGLHVVRKGF